MATKQTKSAAAPKGAAPAKPTSKAPAKAAKAAAPIAAPKAPKAKPGVITNVNSTRSGPPHVVVVAGDHKIMIPTARMSGELQRIAVVGGLLSAVQAYLDAHKPIAKLARGVDGHVAPNAVAAAAAQHKPAPAKAGGATPVASNNAGPSPKPAAPAKAKAPKAPRAVASPKGEYAGRKIKGLVASAAATTLRPGTKRAVMLDAVLRCATTNDALAVVVTVNGTAYPVRADNLRGMVERGHIALA